MRERSAFAFAAAAAATATATATAALRLALPWRRHRRSPPSSKLQHFRRPHPVVARRPTHQLIRQERRRQGSRFGAQPQSARRSDYFSSPLPAEYIFIPSARGLGRIALLYDDNTRASTAETTPHPYSTTPTLLLSLSVIHLCLPARLCSCTVIWSRTRRRPPASY